MTNKLLLEAGVSRFSYYHAGGPGQVPPDGIFDLISVTEQNTAIDPATGIRYAPHQCWIALCNPAQGEKCCLDPACLEHVEQQVGVAFNAAFKRRPIAMLYDVLERADMKPVFNIDR